MPIVDPGSVLRSPIVKRIRELKRLFDLEKIQEDWAESLREMHLPQFRKAGIASASRFWQQIVCSAFRSLQIGLMPLHTLLRSLIC